MAKILLVDDDESILEAVSLVLTDDGHEIVSTSDGNEVMRLAKKEKPSLIILDIMLSGTDGAKICGELKSNSDTLDIPIIIISAHPEAPKLLKDSNADFFLSKPFNLSQLLDSVDKFVS